MIVVQMEVTYMWVPAGAGGAGLGQAQANVAGYGATGTPGAVGNAQKLVLMAMEGVPGGDVPTAANLNTALTTAIADLNTKMTTAGSTGFSVGTPLSVIQGWSTGNP